MQSTDVSRFFGFSLRLQFAIGHHGGMRVNRIIQGDKVAENLSHRQELGETSGRMLILAICALSVFVSACGNTNTFSTTTSELSGDPSRHQCGFSIVKADKVNDACLDGTTVAGPVTYMTGKGKTSAPLSFATTQASTVCTHVDNGAGGGVGPITSADLTLDQTDVLGGHDFGGGIETLEARTQVQGGLHTLTSTFGGATNRSMIVEVRTAEPIHHPIVGPNGSLEIANLRATPQQFSPVGTSGAPTTTTLSVLASLLPGAPGENGNQVFAFDGTFEIASGTTCQPVISFEVQVNGHPRDALLQVVWDGRDSNGNIVPVDAYFYRATINVYRITPGGTRHFIDAAVSQVQIVATDVTPPRIVVEPPRISTTSPSVVIKGQAADTDTGLDSVIVDDNGELTTITVDSLGAFAENIPTPSIPNGHFSSTKTIVVTATDRAANTTSQTVTITRTLDALPAQRIVRALPGTPYKTIAALFRANGAITWDWVRSSGIYLVQFATEAAAISAEPAVRASSAVGSVEQNAVTFPQRVPRDPWYQGVGTLDQESLKFIDSEHAWDISIGSRNATIAVWDTGIDYRQPELENNIFLNEGEMPVDPTEFGAQTIVDANGDGVITLGDLNAPVNVGKVRGVTGTVHIADLIDGNRNVDIGFEGDLNGDGCPGICGVDDDGDGLADWNDPDVAAADYNSNGIPTCGADGICQRFPGDPFGVDDDPEDRDVLAPKDDDENGLADDIAGYDFGCDPGEGGSATCSHDNDPFDHEGHGTNVSGIIGSQEDAGFGGIGIVGMNWETRILPIRVTVADSGEVAPEFATARAAEYTASLARRPSTHLKIVNHSFGALTHHLGVLTWRQSRRHAP